jgi:hypothetical protein
MSVDSRSRVSSPKSSNIASPYAGTVHGISVKRPSHMRSPHRM